MGDADALTGSLTPDGNGVRRTLDGAGTIRARLFLLIVRDAKARAGVMARYGFLPSRLWDALRDEMKATGHMLPAPVGDLSGFPALLLGGIPMYADDCEDSVRLTTRGEDDVKRYAWTSVYAFGLAPSNLGRAPGAAADGDPLGVSGPKESVR